jgi:hypothetical protein
MLSGFLDVRAEMRTGPESTATPPLATITMASASAAPARTNITVLARLSAGEADSRLNVMSRAAPRIRTISAQ